MGKEEDGIRCIIQPCLATLIGDQFDAVMLDEAHLCTNLSASVTQMLIRMQPKYRYALTATPISNIVTNLFSLMGWLSVDNWYKGNLRNAAWPYAREELGRFTSTFLTEERDHTQEQIRKMADKEWKGQCVKVSPVISSPARLLKLLKPCMAYISKEACNPKYQPPKIVDVRVKLGKEQAALYGWFTDRSHIPADHPLVRARKQGAYLRCICCNPAGFEHHTMDSPKVSSNMNPKVIAILELTRDILSRGEQLVIINSRVGLSDTIAEKLAEAGVSMSRIDSTMQAERHSAQANTFKSGKTRVMLLGLKCAAAHSFSNCGNEIIGSLEYSPGPFNQAKGRVDRVNSKPGVTIYCILNKDTIEEVMYDTVAVKDDAATICLKGKRVARDYKPVDAAELMALALTKFDITGATPEMECEDQWPLLRAQISNALLMVKAC